jgi:large subunit ribosomal protein L15
MQLHNIVKLKSSENKKKRVGRGGGSGKGWHTTGKGNKGQKARAGRTLPVGFEGGQVPLYKKMPQIGGFVNHRAKRIISLSLDILNYFEDGSTVARAELIKMGFVKKSARGKVKFLGSFAQDFAKKLNLKGFLFSNSAKVQLEKSGSKVVNA